MVDSQLQELFISLVQKKREIEEGVLPFVEPGSMEEDLAFNDLFYVSKQIGVITQHAKGFTLTKI